MSGPGVVDRRMVIDTLCSILERDNSLLRCRVVRAIERIGVVDDEVKRRLISLLQDPDPDVRMDTALVLGRMRIKEAVEPLIGLLDTDPDGEVRIQAVDALVRIGDRRIVDVLIRYLKDDGGVEYDDTGDDMGFYSFWEIQTRALKALGGLRDERAVEPVCELLMDEECEDVHELGFKVLAQLNTTRAREFLLSRFKKGGRLTRRRIAKALVELRDDDREPPQEMVTALTSALLDKDPWVRIYSARALGEIGGTLPQVVVPLTMLLSDPDRKVRKEVSSVLGRIGGREVVERLVSLLDEPDTSLKKRVVCVLGDIGDTGDGTVTERLEGFLETEDCELLFCVVDALGKIASPGCAERIARILERKDMEVDVRIQCAWALGRILKNRGCIEEDRDDGEEPDGPDPVDVLERSVFDDNERLSFASLTSLMKIDRVRCREILRGIIEDWRKEDDGVVKRDVPVEKENKVETPLESSTDDKTAYTVPTSTIASMMAKTMVEEDEPSSGMPRIRHLKVIAVKVLGEMEEYDRDTIDLLLDALRRTDDSDLKREILLFLGSTGDARVVDSIVDALDSDDYMVRLSALEALKGLADSTVDGLGRVVGLLDDPDPLVRMRSLQILSSSRYTALSEYLPRCLDDEDRDVRKEALKAVAEMGNRGLAGRVASLMFRDAGELRIESAYTLRRLGAFDVARELIAILNDMEKEENHWICIDVLGELFSP